MPTTPAQIDRWREATSESHHLEFKEAKTQFDSKRLCQYCVAIANEGGGALVLGIADRVPRPVVGTAAFGNPLKTTQQLFQRLGFRVDVEEVLHLDGRVVVFNIPARPRGTAYNYEGQYLMRSGETIVSMSEDQLRKIFKEGEPDWLEENSREDVEAGEIIDLLDTQTCFELLGLPYPTDRGGVLDRLLSERLVDGGPGHYSIRRMGICEEKSSGIDRVVEAAEFYQLPAPRFRVGLRRTEVLIYGPRDFDAMDRDDRVRACYQHCVLKWVTAQRMTNQTLRERFRLAERKSANVSQVIAAAIEEGLIKPDERAGASRKFARYLPRWA